MTDTLELVQWSRQTRSQRSRHPTLTIIITSDEESNKDVPSLLYYLYVVGCSRVILLEKTRTSHTRSVSYVRVILDRGSAYVILCRPSYGRKLRGIMKFITKEIRPEGALRNL